MLRQETARQGRSLRSIESLKNIPAQTDNPIYRPGKKLDGCVALISGGESGIGSAVAIHFAKEGARIAIAYYNKHEDAEETRLQVESYGAQCQVLSGDVRDAVFCKDASKEVEEQFGRIDVLVNTVDEQHEADFAQMSQENIERTFAANFFSTLYLAQASLPYMSAGSSIINTASASAFIGDPRLIDYAASKGAVVSYTRSLALSLVDRGIRVNAVALGPLRESRMSQMDSSFAAAPIATVPMKRVAQPAEIAPAYVFLASRDASYITGQTIHVTGGVIAA